MNILKWRKKEKRNYLRWWDILLVTMIMFGYFIWNSLLSFFNLTDTNIGQIPEFTVSLNWYSFFLQFILLLVVFLYLYFINFNFSRWKIKINLESILIGILIFIGVALLFDLYFFLVYDLLISPNVDVSAFYENQSSNQILNRFFIIDLSLILYSILNGIYEELFFLGICLSVTLDKRKYYFIYSLIIRYSFHTYQGNISALAIGFLVGGIYYFLYIRMKEKNLFPFFLAHSITDIFGAGIMDYFF